MVAHEQVNPRDLLKDVALMDENCLELCWSSDHYMPCSHTGGSAGATWPWLGAALVRTDDIQVGTSVTAPILRYNPAIVTQVFATIDSMFPGRTFLTVGTGESLKSPHRQQVATISREVWKVERGGTGNQKALERGLVGF